jgi:hypothetical protein
MFIRRVFAVSAASLAAVVAVSGITYAKPSTNAVPTDQDVVRPPQDVVRQTSAAVSLSPEGGVPTTVIAQSLPAGSWVLSSNATLVSWGPSDYTRCGLYAGDTPLGGATTMVGDPTSPGGSGASVFVATLSVHGAFTSATDKKITLRCLHDSNRPPTGTAYVDPGATVWAHKSDRLATPKPGLRPNQISI